MLYFINSNQFFIEVMIEQLMTLAYATLFILKVSKMNLRIDPIKLYTIIRLLISCTIILQ